MFRVSTFVFYSISLLFDCMCVRLQSIPWSIAGVPSSQVLPGFFITARPSVCVPDVIGALALWIFFSKKLPALSKQINKQTNFHRIRYDGPTHCMLLSLCPFKFLQVQYVSTSTVSRGELVDSKLRLTPKLWASEV